MQAEMEELEMSFEKSSFLAGKLQDYFQFVKFRLSFIVVLSAAAGYLLALSQNFSWPDFGWFLLGGFLVTGGSNGFNQVIEKDTDLLMVRTRNRPLPASRMSVTEGLIAAGIMGLSGVAILFVKFNPLCGILSFISLILYTLAYTPMKPVSNIAVFIGAIPGALPPLIGWVAVSNAFTFGALLIFFLQFIWQFPHFWAIAWVSHDDYSRAGFKLLPSGGGRNRMTAFLIAAYSAGLIPIGLLPWVFGISGVVSAMIVTLCGLIFTLQAFRLMRSGSDAHARQLMFGSFIYLPVVLIALIADKL